MQTILFCVYQPQTLNRRAQNMLDEITNWCSVWRVQLNPNKTQIILFKHPNNSQKRSQKSDEINLTLLGKRLELQDEVCYLGVTFTRTLNWQTDLDTYQPGPKWLTSVRGRVKAPSPFAEAGWIRPKNLQPGWHVLLRRVIPGPMGRYLKRLDGMAGGN
ncbi:hypothetical protein JTB14_034888 [Gonioctena quinquepunctata]|nr:hypothetical protein JTB14_034888 [Gonioctena quinquepunctata]